MTGEDTTAPPEPASLRALFARTMTGSANHLPLALALSCASALLFLLSGVLGRAVPLRAGLALSGLWLIASHAFFITYLTAFITRSPVPSTEELAKAVRPALAALLPVAVLMLAAGGLASAHPWAGVVLWALASGFAVPAHFTRFGWSAWKRLPRVGPVPVHHRLAVLAPSFLVLSATTLIVTAPGQGWGLMQGGIFMIPLAGFTTFWASYSCALFSAEFAREGAEIGSPR